MPLFNNLKKNVSDFTETVAQKSTTAVETQKLKMQKSSLEGDLKDDYEALGKIYAKKCGDDYDPDSEEGKLLIKIKEAKASIEEINEDLRKRKGLVYCPKCGQSVSDEYEYCPKCGAKLVKEAPEETPQEEAAASEDSTYEEPPKQETEE